MWAQGAAKYRAMVEQCNFLGADRPGVQFAPKEASRWMARLCYNDMEKVVTLAKYLNSDRHRWVPFPFGADNCRIHSFSDSDWVGCLRTRCHPEAESYA